MRKLIIVPVLASLFVLLPARETSAWDDYIDPWRANYPEACTTLYALAQNCTLCHTPGFGRNAYGGDLETNGMNYALVGLLDSDDDGRTNDEEINLDCTVPGDAASPAEESTWSSVKALFD